MCLVSLSQPKKSSPKKSTAKSNHNPPKTTKSTAEAHVSPAPANEVSSTTAAAVTPASATSAAPVTSAAPKQASNSSIAAKAIAQLDAIEASLNLDIVIAPNDKKQIGALNRVSSTAIGLASDIVSENPGRFPDFADLPAAASYVETIGQVASRAQELATHVQKSVTNQRVPAATKTLALYAVVKGLGRITDNETMREKVSALKDEVAPKRHAPKPKETKGEKAVKRVAKANAKKVAKAVNVLTTAGVLPTAAAPTTAASVPPATSGITAAPLAPATPGANAANGAAQATPVAGH
jgi:hypothetical protein